MEQKNTVKFVNTIEIEGYLKENSLSRSITAQSNRECISGSLVVALSDEEDYRIRFMAMKTTQGGQENKTYTMLENLLPDNTTSIATLLLSNEGASFSEVKVAATRVWVRGQFNIYDKKETNGDVRSFVTLRGLSAGIKDERSKSPFTPKALFDIEGSIESIKPERDADNFDTGRTKVCLYVPDTYNDVLYPVEFICENTGAVSSISSYKQGDTGRFVGFLRNSRIEELVQGERIEFMDGTHQENSKTTYSFVNERIIEKMTYPYMEDNPKFINKKDVSRMLSNRSAMLEDLMPTPAKTGDKGQFMPNSVSKGFEL